MVNVSVEEAFTLLYRLLPKSNDTPGQMRTSLDKVISRCKVQNRLRIGIDNAKINKCSTAKQFSLKVCSPKECASKANSQTQFQEEANPWRYRGVVAKIDKILVLGH